MKIPQIKFWFVLFIVCSGINYSQSNFADKLNSEPTAYNFTYPQSIFVDSPNGQIWITDFENNRVLRFDVSSLTSINETNGISNPSGYSLNQNYPNPFNSTTKINFKVKSAGNVVLNIFNLLGQKITTPFNEFVIPDKSYSVIFDAAALPSGIYIYSLQTEYGTEVKSMCLLK